MQVVLTRNCSLGVSLESNNCGCGKIVLFFTPQLLVDSGTAITSFNFNLLFATTYLLNGRPFHNFHNGFLPTPSPSSKTFQGTHSVV